MMVMMIFWNWNQQAILLLCVMVLPDTIIIVDLHEKVIKGALIKIISIIGSRTTTVNINNNTPYSPY
jgi:hypothetical protein